MQCYLNCGISKIKTFGVSVLCFFHSHLAYLCLVWVQAKFFLNIISALKKRAIRILHSAPYRDHKCPLLSLENCIFVNKCSNDDAFSLFSNHFKLTASSYSSCTGLISNGLIIKRLYNTISYCNKSIISSTVITWNNFQTIFHVYNLRNMSRKYI